MVYFKDPNQKLMYIFMLEYQIKNLQKTAYFWNE